VQGGWVTLEGQIERMVRHVRGVTASVTLLASSPPASQVEAENEIGKALQREAAVDARQIGTEVSGRTVRLYGRVQSITEVNAARDAAAAAPGVVSAGSRLVISP
jgi:osmotically-inducible protein OsmY